MGSQSSPPPRRDRLAETRDRLGLAPEDLAWLLAVAAAVLLAAAAAWLAPQLANLYPEPATNVFPIWRGAVIPEPVEQARGTMVLAAPFFLALLIASLGAPGATRPSLEPLVIGAQVAAFGLVALAVLEQPHVYRLFLAPDYFDRLLLSVPNLAAGTLLGLSLTALAATRRGERRATLRRVRARIEGFELVAVGLAVFATAIWLLPAVNTDATLPEAGPLATGHIATQTGDYVAIVNGRTPLVDYIAQYANLLPLLVEPVLSALDSSVASITLVMCVLSAIGLLAVYGVFREVARSAWIALILYLPFVALSLFPWNDEGPFREFNGNYFGVLPGRYVGPFLLAWLCALSMRRRVPLWALYGSAGLVVINNAEFGGAALIALTAALLAGRDRSSEWRSRLGRAVGEAAVGLLGAVVISCAVILIRSGELPDPGLLTYFNNLFLRDSFGLVPMPALGLHWALYATHAGALALAAVRFARGDADRTLTAMLAFAGAFGLGSGMYFLGRSVQFQLMLLFPAWALSLALLAWTAAGLLIAAAGDPVRLRRLLLPACATLIGFGVMVSTLDRLPAPWRQVERLADGGPGLPRNAARERYVEANASAGERVLILGTAMDHRVAERAGVVNVSPWNGITALITPDEAELALDALEDEGGSMVFEVVTKVPEQPGLSIEIPEVADLLRDRGYTLEDEDSASALRRWRSTSARR